MFNLHNTSAIPTSSDHDRIAAVFPKVECIIKSECFRHIFDLKGTYNFYSIQGVPNVFLLCIVTQILKVHIVCVVLETSSRSIAGQIAYFYTQPSPSNYNLTLNYWMNSLLSYLKPMILKVLNVLAFIMYKVLKV